MYVNMYSSIFALAKQEHFNSKYYTFDKLRFIRSYYVHHGAAKIRS